MDIKNANSHPFKVAIVSDDNEMYANSHPFQVKVVEGGSEMVTELPETGSKGTMYVLVDDVENPTKAYGIYVYDNGWVLIAQPVDQSVVKVDELPEVGEEGVLYYVPKTGTDTYDLYRWIDDSWIKVDTDIQLYSTTGENTDGAMTQKAVTDALGDKQNALTAGEGINISAQDVISATNTGKAKMLTTADYNYPSDNPTAIALWLLEPGFYVTPTNTSIQIKYTINTGGNTFGSTYIVGNKSDTNRKWVISLDTMYSTMNLYRYMDAAGSYVETIYLGKPIDNLTSTYTDSALSANQGRVLNTRIGDLTTLTTTDKTSAVAAINELDSEVAGKQDTLTAGEAINISAQNVISATNTGKAKVLTSADYNYPVDNPTSVALWLLEPGLYTWSQNYATVIYPCNGTPSTNYGSCLVLPDGAYSTYKTIVLFGSTNSVDGTYGSQAQMAFRVSISDGTKVLQRSLSYAINDTLTSTRTYEALSANQGRVLNEHIGDLTALNTTDKTSAVAAINEVLANAGKPIELTTADYNYPTNNPTSVALWLLEPGIYWWNSSVNIGFDTSRIATYSPAAVIISKENSNDVEFAKITTFSGDDIHSYITRADTGAATDHTNYNYLTGKDVVDSLTSTSTWMPLSANQGKVLKGLIDENLGKARTLTTADYNYPENNPTMINTNTLPAGVYLTQGQINYGNQSGGSFWESNSIVVFQSKANFIELRYDGRVSRGISVGSTSLISGQDVVNNLTSTVTNKPLSANQGRVLNEKIEGRVIQNAGAPTTSTVGIVGQLLEDTTNGNVYLCTAIDTTTDPQNPAYTWEKLAKDSDLPVTLTNAQYEALWSTSNALNDYLETIISGEGV